MKRVSGLVTIAVAVLALSACGQLHGTRAGTEAERAPRTFRSAGEWIHTLNQDGVTCRPTGHPGVGAMDALELPAACVLRNGDRLTVLIVRNAAKTYQDQFAKAKTSERVLYGANWIVIVPRTAPSQSIQKIRDLFGARG